MKKLLLLLALLIPSASAHGIFYTYEAMHCMKLRECTEGVEKLSSEDYEGEAKTIIDNLDQMGVEVYNAIPQYFVDEYRALYYSDTNTIFINQRYGARKLRPSG